jgi:hypothetical protein
MIRRALKVRMVAVGVLLTTAEMPIRRRQEE